MSASQDFTIRAGVAADLEAMYQMDVRCFDEVFRFSRAAMHRFSQGRNRFTFIAESADGQMAGFVILSLHRRHGLGYIVTLDVEPAYRRRGVAALLMQAAEQHGAADPVACIELHVHVGNAAALALYAELGYRRNRLESGFYGEGLDAWVYVKELTQEPAISA